MRARKQLFWVCGSKKDLKQMPTLVMEDFGFALDQVQRKKSTAGIKTSQADIDLIRNRLRAAQDHAKGSENDRN